VLSIRNSFALAALALLIVIASSCVRLGEPTSQERAQLARWSNVVTDEDRADVRREADTHTEWMERKKAQWMISEYRSRYAKARAKATPRAAATQRAATQRAATMPATTQALQSISP
jgi:hypothetical protein